MNCVSLLSINYARILWNQLCCNAVKFHYFLLASFYILEPNFVDRNVKYRPVRNLKQLVYYSFDFSWSFSYF